MFHSDAEKVSIVLDYNKKYILWNTVICPIAEIRSVQHHPFKKFMRRSQNFKSRSHDLGHSHFRVIHHSSSFVLYTLQPI